uniref:hypothetical protein n=1 Tax=Demequina sp. TaxID=2050685 RepID=UPI0025C3443E
SHNGHPLLQGVHQTGAKPSAIFEWIEGFYNPHRHHTGLTDDHGRSLSHVTVEALHTHLEFAA